jgi:hypothetical protein
MNGFAPPSPNGTKEPNINNPSRENGDVGGVGDVGGLGALFDLFDVKGTGFDFW